jgi:hypothetical protein
MRNNEDRLGTNQIRQDATPFQQIANQPQSSTTPLQATPLDFMVPTEYVPLPSRGLLYPNHHPLYGKDSIEIKQMTAKEEDILTSRNLLKKGVALDKLIQSLVVDKNINTDTLTIEDRNAIIVAARISAYGSEYITQVTCPSCDQKVKSTFDLHEKLESLEEQEQPSTLNENGLFTLVLPVSKYSVVCRALNGMDEKELMRLSEAKKKNTAGDSTLLDQLRCMVVSIQGVEDKETIARVLSALPAGDSRYLRKQYQATVKGIDLKKTFVCSSCSYEAEIEVPLTADFFWIK